MGGTLCRGSGSDAGLLSHSGADRSSKAAFTLIELLVVIGIIGILAGLLLPALAQARERGRSAKCISNLRQMGSGMCMYGDDYGCYPPGHLDGVTQWDSCISRYVAGTHGPDDVQARTALFMCPSARKSNSGHALNYSANPNVCKEIKATAGPVPQAALSRAADIIVVADAIQYASDGDSQAILWGVQGSNGSEIYWDNGDPSNAARPIGVGVDKDEDWATSDPNGANFRYRHAGNSVNALFADGHVASFVKGQIQDRNMYTNY